MNPFENPVLTGLEPRLVREAVLLNTLRAIIADIDAHGCGFESSSETFWSSVERGRVVLARYGITDASKP